MHGWCALALSEAVEWTRRGSPRARHRGRLKLSVATFQSREFGDPKAGLDSDEQQGVVAAASSYGAVWCGQPGFDLGRVEKRNGRGVGALVGDGEHSLDGLGVLIHPGFGGTSTRPGVDHARATPSCGQRPGRGAGL